MTMMFQLRHFCAPRRAASLGLVLLLALGNSASADLIPLSLRYDANVKVGSDVGVEKHFSNNPAELPPPNTGTLPADNSMLPGALVDGNNLIVSLSQLSGHTILIITPPLLKIFNNPADPAFTYPVQFDGLFYSDELGPNEAISITDIQFEGAIPVLPFPSPTSEMISAGGPNFGDPLGSINNPVRIQLGFTAAEMGVGQIVPWNKFHFFYETVEIPEPTSWALVMLGIAGIATTRRRSKSIEA